MEGLSEGMLYSLSHNHLATEVLKDVAPPCPPCSSSSRWKTPCTTSSVRNPVWHHDGYVYAPEGAGLGADVMEEAVEGFGVRI